MDALPARVGDRESRDRRTEEEKPERLESVPPMTWRVSERRPRPAPAMDGGREEEVKAKEGYGRGVYSGALKQGGVITIHKQVAERWPPSSQHTCERLQRPLCRAPDRQDHQVLEPAQHARHQHGGAAQNLCGTLTGRRGERASIDGVYRESDEGEVVYGYGQHQAGVKGRASGGGGGLAMVVGGRFPTCQQLSSKVL